MPSGIIVESQRFRELCNNRKEARKLLSLELDDRINGPLSKRNIEIAKIKKQKAKQESRTRKKMDEKESLKVQEKAPLNASETNSLEKSEANSQKDPQDK